MTAKIISMAQQKGGAGKTTVTMTLAAELAKRGHRVLVVDADPQASGIRWAAAASDEEPFPATVIGLAQAGQAVHREIRRHIDNYDRILIDCPPSADSPVAHSSLLISDLVLVPTVPSPLDMRAGIGIRQAIEAAQTVNEALQTRIVHNMVTNTKLARDVQEIQAQYNIQQADTKLANRNAYRLAALYGTGIEGDAKADAEVQKLADEVEEILK